MKFFRRQCNRANRKRKMIVHLMYLLDLEEPQEDNDYQREY